jgi:hypothetical protein
MNRDRRSPSSRLCATWAALSLPLLLGPAQARELVDRAAVQRVITSPAVVERAQQLNALAERGAAGELVAQLRRLSQDTQEGSIPRAWLLDRGMHELSRLRPTDEARALLNDVAQQPPQVFVRVDPDHGSHAIPLYDPAATARFVLRQWERVAAREEASAALAAGNSQAVDTFTRDLSATEIDPRRAGIVDAFRSASVGALARQRSAIIAAIGRGDRVDEIAAVTAERLRDIELLGLVLDNAEPAVALSALRRARDVLGDTAALDVLVVASRREQIASAALLEIGRIAQQDSRARAYLFETMDDPAAAPSAAAALASLHDPAVASELGRLLNTTTNEAKRRQLALSLKLDGSTAARGQLELFVKSKAGSAALRKEIRAWLTQ